MPVKYTDDALTTLASGLGASATVCQVASSSTFPTLSTGDYFYATLQRASDNAKETVRVDAVTGSTWTIVRAQGLGETALAFVTGDAVELRIGANLLDDLSTPSDTATGIADETLVATSDGQTLFTLTEFTYNIATEGGLDLFYKGVRLERDVEWTATSSSSFTLTFGTVKTSDRIVAIRTQTVSSATPLAANTTYQPDGANTFETNVQAQLRLIRHIEDFADDTETDFSTAFVNAAATGDLILLKPGTTYIANSAATLANGSAFVCLGGVATIQSTASSSVNLFSGTGLSDIWFENIVFDMPVCSGALDVTPIDLVNVTNFTARNVQMDDGFNLIHIFGGTSVYVERCRASLPYSYGVILADDITDAWVYDGRFHGSVIHDGIKVAGSVTSEAPVHTNIHIYGNTCYDNARDGIDVAINSATKILIHDNVLYNNALNAIEYKLLDTDPVAFSNGSINDNVISVAAANATGISVIAADATSTTLMSDIAVHDNNVKCSNTTNQTGIKLTNVHDSEVHDNKVINGLYAYRFLASSECTLDNNRANGSGNFVLLATDGTNSPSEIDIKNNSGKNLVSRFYWVTDSSTANCTSNNNRSDAPIDTVDGTGWKFSNGAGSIEDKTANFNAYASHDGATFTNIGTSANVTITLNDVEAGLEYSFYQQAGGTYNFDVSPPAGVSIGGGGAGKDMRLRTDNGLVKIKAMSTTRFEIVSENGITITYEP